MGPRGCSPPSAAQAGGGGAGGGERWSADTPDTGNNRVRGGPDPGAQRLHGEILSVSAEQMTWHLFRLKQAALSHRKMGRNTERRFCELACGTVCSIPLQIF